MLVDYHPSGRGFFFFLCLSLFLLLLVCHLEMLRLAALKFPAAVYDPPPESAQTLL